MFESINRFTEEQIIGLNISDFSVEAVVLYKKRKSWRLVSFARYRLSPGIVENGEILQPDKFKEELKKMFSLVESMKEEPLKNYLLNRIFVFLILKVFS